MESGTYVGRSNETVARFMASWDSYMSTQVRARTLQGYRQKLKAYIIPCLGGVKMQSLTAKHVHHLHRWMLDKGLSNRSVLHAHRVLSKAMSDAIDWKIISSNPAKSVKPPRPEDQPVEVWDMTTLRRFLDGAADHLFFDAFKLFLYTGMRRSELTGLHWDDVDFGTRSVRVTSTLQRVTGHKLLPGQPKTKASRRAIAIGQTAVDLLHDIKVKQLALQYETAGLYQNPEGYVFTDLQGNPIDSDRLSKAFAKEVMRLQLPHATLHSLRHIHASLLLADGVNIKAISERLGHGNISLTLNVYSHLLPGLQEAAAEALDRRLSYQE